MVEIVTDPKRTEQECNRTHFQERKREASIHQAGWAWGPDCGTVTWKYGHQAIRARVATLTKPPHSDNGEPATSADDDCWHKPCKTCANPALASRNTAPKPPGEDCCKQGSPRGPPCPPHLTHAGFRPSLPVPARQASGTPLSRRTRGGVGQAKRIFIRRGRRRTHVH